MNLLENCNIVLFRNIFLTYRAVDILIYCFPLVLASRYLDGSAETSAQPGHAGSEAALGPFLYVRNKLRWTMIDRDDPAY